jgi:hypothetical protein
MLRYYKTGRIGLEGDGASRAKLGCNNAAPLLDGFAR